MESTDFKRYFNPLLIISDADTLKGSKSLPVTYVHLLNALDKLGLRAKLFVDNTERNVFAASQLGGPSNPNPLMPNLYHFDRTASGLMAPEQKDGYVRIAKLDQMKEL